jgi:hypothetical protein
VGVNAEAWAELIPYDQGRLRREIKDVARQVLGREFELYELRKFFATPHDKPGRSRVNSKHLAGQGTTL